MLQSLDSSKSVPWFRESSQNSPGLSGPQGLELLLMEEIRRSPVDMVNIPIIYDGFQIFWVVVWDFIHEQYLFEITL